VLATPRSSYDCSTNETNHTSEYLHPKRAVEFNRSVDADNRELKLVPVGWVEAAGLAVAAAAVTAGEAAKEVAAATGEAGCEGVTLNCVSLNHTYQKRNASLHTLILSVSL
jgi:hypothetical protein